MEDVVVAALRKNADWVAAGWDDPPPQLFPDDILGFFMWLQEQNNAGSTTPAELGSCVLTQSASRIASIVNDAHHITAESVNPDIHAMQQELNQEIASAMSIFKRTHPSKGTWYEVVDAWIASLLGTPSEDKPKELFFNKLKTAEAADVVDTMRSFINRIKASMTSAEAWWSDSRIAAAITEFCEDIELVLHNHPLWRTTHPDEWCHVVAGLHKFVVCMLTPTDPYFAEQDGILMQKYEELSFVTPKHLDFEVPEWLDSAWLLASLSLKLVQQYRSPKDKVKCMQNCTLIVTLLLSFVDKNVNGNSGFVGADALIPALIYTVLRAKMPYLSSSIAIIEKYSSHDLFASELGYTFTNLVSAASFITTATSESFTNVSLSSNSRRRTLSLHHETLPADEAKAAASVGSSEQDFKHDDLRISDEEHKVAAIDLPPLLEIPTEVSHESEPTEMDLTDFLSLRQESNVEDLLDKYKALARTVERGVSVLLQEAQP